MRRSLRRARRTKIGCTIGPATQSREGLDELFAAGMDVARMNFSRGDQAWHAERIRLLREISAEHGRPLGILVGDGDIELEWLIDAVEPFPLP